MARAHQPRTAIYARVSTLEIIDTIRKDLAHP